MNKKLAGPALALALAAAPLAAKAQTMNDATVGYFPGAEHIWSVQDSCKAGKSASRCETAVRDLSAYVLKHFREIIGTGSNTSGGEVIAYGTREEPVFVPVPAGIVSPWQSQAARANAACSFLTDGGQRSFPVVVEKAKNCVGTVIHDTEALNAATGGNTYYASMAKAVLERINPTTLASGAPVEMASVDPDLGRRAAYGVAGLVSGPIHHSIR